MACSKPTRLPLYTVKSTNSSQSALVTIVGGFGLCSNEPAPHTSQFVCASRSYTGRECIRFGSARISNVRLTTPPALATCSDRRPSGACSTRHGQVGSELQCAQSGARHRVHGVWTVGHHVDRFVYGTTQASAASRHTGRPALVHANINECSFWAWYLTGRASVAATDQGPLSLSQVLTLLFNAWMEVVVIIMMGYAEISLRDVRTIPNTTVNTGPGLVVLVVGFIVGMIDCVLSGVLIGCYDFARKPSSDEEIVDGKTADEKMAGNDHIVIDLVQDTNGRRHRYTMRVAKKSKSSCKPSTDTKPIDLKDLDVRNLGSDSDIVTWVKMLLTLGRIKVGDNSTEPWISNGLSTSPAVDATMPTPTELRADQHMASPVPYWRRRREGQVADAAEDQAGQDIGIAMGSPPSPLLLPRRARLPITDAEISVPVILQRQRQPAQQGHRQLERTITGGAISTAVSSQSHAPIDSSSWWSDPSIPSEVLWPPPPTPESIQTMVHKPIPQSSVLAELH